MIIEIPLVILEIINKQLKELGLEIKKVFLSEEVLRVFLKFNYKDFGIPFIERTFKEILASDNFKENYKILFQNLPLDLKKIQKQEIKIEKEYVLEF